MSPLNNLPGGQDAPIHTAGGGGTGSTIAIARGPRTIAHPVPADSGERELGFGGYRLPDSFFDELPEEEVGAGEGA